jgi:peptidoglycan/LPS O-acetylase OafA/YrhL
MAMHKRPNLPALTGLRFLLAPLIVFEHQSGPEGMLQLGARPVPPWLANLFESGYAAVGFFFMLSGFVLAYGRNLALPWSAADRRLFYLARVSRVYPVYALGLLLALPFTLAALGHVVRRHGYLAGARWGLPVAGYGWFALYATAAVAASIAVFLGVEEPMRRWLLRRFGMPRGRK